MAAIYHNNPVLKNEKCHFRALLIKEMGDMKHLRIELKCLQIVLKVMLVSFAARFKVILLHEVLCSTQVKCGMAIIINLLTLTPMTFTLTVNGFLVLTINGRSLLLNYLEVYYSPHPKTYEI